MDNLILYDDKNERYSVRRRKPAADTSSESLLTTIRMNDTP